MRAPAALLAIVAVAWSVTASAEERPAGAAAAPGADQIQFAAHEHDLGYRAYVDKRYEEAATHFENAFFAAPNQAELRSAIRARRDAGELPRAATLAALGLRKFPGDAVTARLADEVIAQARPQAFEVRVTSSADCSILVDDKLAIGERGTDARVFVAPGKHDLVVSWSDDRSAHVPIAAVAGESQTLALEPPAAAPAPPPAAPPATAAGPVVSPPVEPLPPPPRAPAQAPGSAQDTRPFGPVVFVTGAVVTAALGGITVWSRIDAQNNPGPDTVRRVCAGLYDSCPAYQQGVDADRRTYLLLAGTGVAAVATTVVGVFFTQWSRGEAPGPRAEALGHVTPLIGLDRVGLQGTF
jgi:hypothetical protein